MRTTPVALLLTLLGSTVAAVMLAACQAPQMVPLLGAAGIPITLTPAAEVPLEVVTRGTGIPDPLPLSGSSVVYSDVEAALGHAVASATAFWAESHRGLRPEGWQLFVELTRAQAHFQHAHGAHRLTVAFDARATLKTRLGNLYLAQTHVSCRQAGLAPADQAAPILYSCMTSMSRDLAAWLSSIPP